jgi:UDP-3-O-[3-hydroxymyristoyl] N-acetylglucosamine deacetylase
MNQTPPLILIVDDEESIGLALKRVLLDEGFTTLELTRGEEVVAAVKEHKPALILLDIWLPGTDGIEVLKLLRAVTPQVPVVMMSGHATIATAMEATRQGAVDFVEKPIDLHALLLLIKRILSTPTNKPRARAQSASSGKPPSAESPPSSLSLEALVFDNYKFPDEWRGPSVPQRTLRSSAILYGQGLHSGAKSGLILEPLPPHSGIHFARVSDVTTVPAHVSFVDTTRLATTLHDETRRFGTVEHVLSALHAYGISNLLLKCNGEVPVMDGSTHQFCSLFDEIGTIEQEGEWYELVIPRPIRIGNSKEWMEILPHDSFSIHYTLDYPYPVGRHEFEFTLDDPTTYVKEISSARTFGFVKDIGALQKQGLALGGRFDNFVMIGDDGPLNDTLRYPNEFVRHKVLDAIGDLYLLGRRIRGKVRAVMTGHSDNVSLLRAILEEAFPE